MEINAKLGLLTAAAISLATLPALADKHEPSEKPAAAKEAEGSRQGGGEREFKFEEFKAKHVQRMKETLACVEAAQDFQALRKCKPERGGRGGMKGGPEKPSGGTGGGAPQ